MASYKFSQSAENDLAEIIEYTVTAWGVAQANNYIDGLEVVAAKLASTAEIGKVREELVAKLKSFPYQQHVLFYTQQRRDIIIVRILHQRKDVTKAMLPSS